MIKQLANVTSFSFYIGNDNVINTLVKLGGKRQLVNEYYKALQSTDPNIRVFAAKTLAKINDAGPKNEGRVVILIEQKQELKRLIFKLESYRKGGQIIERRWRF